MGSLAEVLENEAVEGGSKKGGQRGGGWRKKEPEQSWFSQVVEHNGNGLSTAEISPG